MRIAHIVPLRRFDAAHWWFDYAIPGEQNVQPGQFVEIGFRNKTLRGLVWSVSSGTPNRPLQPIQRLITPEIVVTAWQRQVMETIAMQTCSSLGQIAKSIVPTWPKRKSSLRKETLSWIRPGGKKRFAFSDTTLWYQNRADVQEKVMDWLAAPGKSPRLVLVPTIDDGAALQAKVSSAGGSVPFFSSHLTPAQYRRLYQQVLRGKLTRVLGTASALALPFPTPPKILIDQEEHPNHKVIGQPRFDVREVIHELSVEVQSTTPAPSIVWYDRHHPNPPTPNLDLRSVWSLHDPSMTPWITYHAQSMLEEATSNQPVFLIAPQHGYASQMRCRHCGYVRECPHCGATVRLFAHRGQMAVCRACQTSVPETLRCPNCRGSEWAFAGLGIDRVRHLLRDLLPNHRTGTWDDNRTEVAIGTYADIRRLPSRPWQAMIVLAGDALLHWPDFSVQERAWQFLHRLQAWNPKGRLAVQTFNPTNAFWTAWLSGQHASWYQNELRLRKKLGLPPYREHWLIRRPRSGSGPTLVQVQTRLKRINRPDMRIELAGTVMHDGKSVERMVISGPGQPPLRQHLPWQELFPYPWQVDTKPTSWLL